MAAMRSSCRLNGRNAGGFDLLRIHAGGIEIADLLFYGIGRRAFIPGRGFQDRAQNLLIAVLHFVEPAPARIFRRNGIALDPAAVGVLEKVLAGIAGGIQIGQIEAVAVRVRGSHRIGHSPQAARKSQEHRRQNHQAEKHHKHSSLLHGSPRYKRGDFQNIRAPEPESNRKLPYLFPFLIPSGTGRRPAAPAGCHPKVNPEKSCGRN